MAITVEIIDRQFDYTDEEKAAEAVSEFQLEKGLDDHEIISLWVNGGSQVRRELEGRIVAAIDANGSQKRAQETIPAEITLSIAATDV